MASGINLELIIGLVIGWVISDKFLKGPVSDIANQVLGSLGSVGGGAPAGGGRTKGAAASGYGG